MSYKPASEYAVQQVAAHWSPLEELSHSSLHKPTPAALLTQLQGPRL